MERKKYEVRVTLPVIVNVWATTSDEANQKAVDAIVDNGINREQLTEALRVITEDGVRYPDTYAEVVGVSFVIDSDNHPQYGPLKPFRCEGTERTYYGFDTGQTWNGWAVPLVTPETRDQLLADCADDIGINEALERGDTEWLQDICEMKQAEGNEDGLISLFMGWCFYWDEEEEAA